MPPRNAAEHAGLFEHAELAVMSPGTPPGLPQAPGYGAEFPDTCWETRSGVCLSMQL